MKESRKNIRYKSPEQIDLSVQKIELLAEEIFPLYISVSDISKGGICVKLKNKLDTGKQVSINLELGNKKHLIISEVKWVRKEKNIYNVGLKIVFASELFMNNLSKMIHEIETKKIYN